VNVAGHVVQNIAQPESKFKLRVIHYNDIEIYCV